MKRYLVAAGIGSLVFAGALGSAAALNVNGNPVAQYGEDMNLVCDPNGVTVDGFFVDSDGVSASHGIVLSDIASACGGKTLVATATGNTGQQLRKAFGEIPANGGSMTLSWASVPMGELYGVRLTIG